MLYLGVLGELFRGGAAERGVLGELFRGSTAGELLKALMVRVSGGRSPCGHTSSARRNFACNSLQGISSHELQSLKFCRFWLVVDVGSAGIACDL